MTQEAQTPMLAAKADCYSASERRAMLWTQRLRHRWLLPLLRLLNACQVTPDHLTALSLTCGLAFCALFLVSKPAAFCCLMLHVLFDGIDGPLARYTNVASRSGSFTDTMSDQVVVVATTIVLMISQSVGVVAGSLYIFLYTVVVLFAMVRNALAIPYTWLVRPRFTVYAWMIVEAYWWQGSLNYMLWGFNVLLAAKLLSGFLQIRRRI